MNIIYWNTLGTLEQEVTLSRPHVTDRARTKRVAKILEQVRDEGDDALFHFTQEFDQVSLSALQVSEAEMNSALASMDQSLLTAIDQAIARIEAYQRACQLKPMEINHNDGIRCRKIPRAIEKIGLYVPGGSAPLISTIMMLAIPAKLAGCRRRIMCTPPNQQGEIHPAMLVTAKRCGIDTIFKLGGAQAIAAMAYGTESVEKVDKIYGPGNVWVTQAKQVVSQDFFGAAIDLPAGPSEIMVIADQHANPRFVAADLLSQAEHGVDSQVILLTDSEVLAEQVLTQLTIQLNQLVRRDFAEKSLQASNIILVESMEQAIELCNAYAPEHLSLQLADPEAYLDKIHNASAILMGAWTAESMGDYVNGANHVLPTSGFSRSVSGLSVADFCKWLSVQEVSEAGLQRFGPLAEQLAEVEGLDAHKQAVTIRLAELES